MIDYWHFRPPEFAFVQPEDGRTGAGLFEVALGPRPLTLLELPGAPIDWINTRLPEPLRDVRRLLSGLAEIPRMSTLANAALLNAAVRRMEDAHTFVNVGVWNGFTFLSGMAGNAERRCVGIDDFSQFGGPRDAFLERFEAARSSLHSFHDMAYEEYFRGVHDGPIGVYLYDGEHSYANQRRGLEAAEPFFADACIVIVDDTNWPAARQATLDFAAESDFAYELLLDAATAGNQHPTYWNGLLVLRCRKGGGGNAVAQRPDPVEAGGARPEGSSDDPTATRTVSLVVCNEDASFEELTATVDSALSQSWPSVEVLVADASGAALGETRAAFGDRIVPVDPRGSPCATFRAAAAQATGSFVGFVETPTKLIDTAVHLALGDPALASFFSGRLTDTRRRRLEQWLLAGAEVERVVPPGATYGLITGGLDLPRTVRGRTAHRLLERGETPASIDDATALERLRRLRGLGIGHVVVLWSASSWLAERPDLAAYLDEQDCVLDTQRARVFRLRG